MEPEEITTENWVGKLVEYLNPVQAPLTSCVREQLSIEGQSSLRTMRDRLPDYRVTVATVEEE